MLGSRGVRRNRRFIIGLARRPGGRRQSGSMGAKARSWVAGPRMSRQQPRQHRLQRDSSDGMNRSRMAAAKIAAVVVACGLILGGCFSETYQRGYIVPDGALEQIPIGSTQEQVLIVLGTPSTVATVNGEAFYYISQRAERPVGFMPQSIVNQRVVAVYFDKNRRVERLANYGMRDGRVFDFVSRTTPTGGKDVAYINALFKIF